MADASKISCLSASVDLRDCNANNIPSYDVVPWINIIEQQVMGGRENGTLKGIVRDDSITLNTLEELLSSMNTSSRINVNHNSIFS